MKYKSNIFNTLILIITIVIGIFIADRLYYKENTTSKNFTYIHVENNITPFVFNKIVIPKVANDETIKEEPISPVEKPKEKVKTTEEKKQIEVEKQPSKTPEIVTNIVFDGLTMEQLVIRLNNNMKNELSNMGQLYAEYSLALGVDPYVALAITLHETGCFDRCSEIMRYCNNVGGQVGTPRCGNGRFKKYDTLEEGIKGYLNNLSDNYYKQGLNTPELINTRYATNPTWYEDINDFVNTIKSN